MIQSANNRLKIAMLAPQWETVPPKTYGGIELVVALLVSELIQQGHSVTLYASGDSQIPGARLDSVIQSSMRASPPLRPDVCDMMLVQKVLECCDDYDIVHSHIGELALLAGKASSTPWVHTWHNALTEDSRVLMTNSLQDHFSISNSHRVNGVDYRGTVYNGIRLSDYGVGNGRREYLAFLGRFSPEKGPDKAIEYAKAVNVPLVMAGKIGEQDREFFESDVRPHIDGDFISYIGEVNLEEKNRLLGNALALLFLINWSEPFGLVMIESMACGTPVIALKKGAVPEVVIDGKTGIFGDCLPELIARFSEISDISASACRKHVENNFSAQAMCDSYLWHYREILGHTVL